jgi:hypothetical protein
VVVVVGIIAGVGCGCSTDYYLFSREQIMLYLTLSSGATITLDDDTHAGHTWRINHQGYIVRSAYQPRGMPRTIYLHREVAGAGVGDVVRHKDGNKLDCRFDNLEIIRKGS